MKITPKVDSRNIYSDIELFDTVNVPKSERKRAAEEVGEFLVEKTLEAVSKTSSPVSGAPYKAALSPSYKKWKQSEGRGDKANMELYGDMLDALTFKATTKGVKIGLFNTIEALKADGHNNFSKRSDLPERRFLPKDGETYKREIDMGVKDILDDYIVKSKTIDEADLKDIEDKPSLWQLLESRYPEIDSRSELRDAVYRNEDLLELLEDFGMLKWLK